MSEDTTHSYWHCHSVGRSCIPHHIYRVIRIHLLDQGIGVVLCTLCYWFIWLAFTANKHAQSRELWAFHPPFCVSDAIWFQLNCVAFVVSAHSAASEFVRYGKVRASVLWFPACVVPHQFGTLLLPCSPSALASLRSLSHPFLPILIAN